MNDLGDFQIYARSLLFLQIYNVPPKKRSELAPQVLVSDTVHGLPPASKVSTVQKSQSLLPPTLNDPVFKTPLTARGFSATTSWDSVLNVKKSGNHNLAKARPLIVLSSPAVLLRNVRSFGVESHLISTFSK